MFTPENTEGLTIAQLRLLNVALEIRLARGENEKTAQDAITNAWHGHAGSSSLI